MNKSRIDHRATAQTTAIERLNARLAIDGDLLAWASRNVGRGHALLEAHVQADR
jgi:hypothetical protein